jgi:hypothetical protein
VRLLRGIDVETVGMVVAMKQTNRWEEALHALDGPVLQVRGVCGAPLFERGDDGWWPVAGTQPDVP